MISIENHLQQYGLSEKEAKLYIAALDLGTASVGDIAKKAGIKRPTAYVILDRLKELGLISEKPASRGSIFFAEDPSVLKHQLRAKRRALDNALPMLTAMYGVEKDRPNVKVYEGIEGMEQAYQQTVWQSSTEVLFFSSIEDVYKGMPNMLERWLETMQSGKNSFESKTKELINPTKADIEYGLRATEGSPADIRVIPPDSPFKLTGTDNAIFEDKVLMVSFDQKLFTTIIQSQAMADTMRTLYHLAWQNAIPINQFIQDHPEYTSQ